ncbi:tyrosine-type recombinase/integrase [Azohydromonas caseinilytica]|uniref:Site-specific integrase n=1 Tax=Azohydromonas caseinilytica TaxID=2728836 RepID=A0A848FCU1_9BURK|nr:site-specific integrase [Azohydromonas caseinilytica]NML16796.1 site-specific integrase [Azohydromonas caseinilytica]
MNLDLFEEEPHGAGPLEFQRALTDWLRASQQAGQVRRDSSAAVYEHMWSALAQWCVARGIALDEITAADLDAYIASRGGFDELTSRYALRLLRLVERVMEHRRLAHGLPANRAATELIAARADVRFANSHARDPLPEVLPASEAKRLVSYLADSRPRPGGAGYWQDLRNRASVALMLGAGLTPGDVRALTLEGVVFDGGRVRELPWKLRLPGNGNSPARETPMAPWAARLLASWLQVRRQQGIPGPMCFPSTKSSGKPWGKVAQYTAARTVLLAAGIEDVEGGSYKLRHTFALRQLRKGKPSHEIARWLGLSDPAMMERYKRILITPVELA